MKCILSFCSNEVYKPIHNTLCIKHENELIDVMDQNEFNQ